MNQKILNNSLYVLVLMAVSFAAVAVYSDFSVCVECSVLDRVRKASPWSQAFLSCSNIEQRIDLSASKNIKEEIGEVDGWTKITAADPSREATVVVRFKKDPGQRRVVFYPRVGGDNSEVTVHEDVRSPGLLFLLKGQQGAWTPLGGQYPFNFLCLEYGFQTWKPFEAMVVVTLRGPWAQLWHKGGAVFF